MKKRFVCMLLITAMLVSFAVAPASASGAQIGGSATDATDTCPCGCGKSLDKVTWTPYAGEAVDGHYYLTEDFVQNGEYNVVAGNKVVLDLRGHIITTSGQTRLFLVNGYLAVLDTVGGGRLCARALDESPGGVVWVADNETNDATFELYSGTVTLGNNPATPSGGGLVYASGGGSFIMYGGVLLDGISSGDGGALAVSGDTSEAKVLGGKIIGGKSTAGNGGNVRVSASGYLELKNCEILSGEAKNKGGNVYVNAATAVIEGCTIAHGVSNHTSTGTRYGGGNICTYATATLTLTDSTIYNGYALYRGGNICFGNGTHTLKNNTIFGGVAELEGQNLYSGLSNAISIIEGGNIDGGVYYGNSPLTLKGAVKIGLKNNGLLLKQTSKTVNASGLTDGAEIYVDTTYTITGGKAAYFKPAYRTVLTTSGSNLKGSVAADGAIAGYCPHCAQQVAWSAYGTENATHTYLTADMAAFETLSVTGDLVIDLCGFDITATGRAFTVAEGGCLTVIDSLYGGIVTGSGVAAEAGGVISNAGTLKLYSGKYVYSNNANIAISSGGVIANSGTLNIYGGIYDGSAYSNTADTGLGGAICNQDGESVSLTMNGGRVMGGSAYSGGGIYAGYNNTVTITGVSFVGGIAANVGGNFACIGASSDANGTLTMTGVSLTGGKSNGDYAGNLYLGRYKSCSVTDSYIANGSSKKYGGNFSVGLSTNATLTQCIVTNGAADSNGGQVYLPGKSSNLTLDRCLLTNGSAYSGGNVHVNNGCLTVKGGEISYGTAANSGGNIYTGTADKTGTTLTADSDGNPPLICAGTATAYGGNIYAKNIFAATDAFINKGSAGNAGGDLYVGSTETLAVTFGAGLTGNLALCVDKALFASENIYGGAISKITVNSPNATFYLDGNYNNCGTVVNNSTFYVATTAVVDASGDMVWHMSNANAVDACDADSYLKLFTDNDLVLTKDCYVDLNGHTVNISGAYKLYGMDSTGDNYAEPSGKATVAAETSAEAAASAPNSGLYLKDTAEDGSVSYHRLGMAITGISLRPSVSGIYYTAKWSCDDTLKAKITAYGTAVSVEEMPTADFVNQAHCKYTVADLNDFTSGVAKTSAIITNILTEDADAAQNNEKGKSPIYATAYVVIDGVTYLSDRDGEQDDVDFSLYNVMKSLDGLIVRDPLHYRKFNLSARNFYEQWRNNGMGDWKLNKIPDPGEDDVIDVLMIGSSFCYYYVEELHALAKAAGISMRVCNVYDSGCPLVDHYNWWVAGQSKYQYFETYTDGRKTVGTGVSLEWCLAQREWDFISLQESSSKTVSEGAQAHYNSTKLYWEGLLDYLMEQFPQAEFLWHQTWTNQLIHPKENSVIKNAEDQATSTQIMEDYATLICNYYNDGQAQTQLWRVPSGRAWQNTRNQGYDLLCCRLGKTNPVTGVAHAGDGYHDGDIGGGQYLNACVWFEIITGQSVVGNPYIPDYKTTATISDGLLADLRVNKTEIGYALTQDLVTLLQTAAHDAVASTGVTVTDGNYTAN